MTSIISKNSVSVISTQRRQRNAFVLRVLRGFLYVVTVKLFKRDIEFDGRSLALGGIGGVCVAENMRRKGIATEMIRKGLEVLREKGCEVACLNADLSRNVYRLYENIGFKLMDRKISFEDINGKIRYDDGTMFVPLCSKEIFEHIMKSDKTFHYGKGYW